MKVYLDHNVLVGIAGRPRWPDADDYIVDEVGEPCAQRCPVGRVLYGPLYTFTS
jgi:hypothetical protein